MKKSRNPKKREKDSHKHATAGIAFNDLPSLIQLVMHGATKTLGVCGFVNAHFVAVVESEFRFYPMPVGGDTDIEFHKQHVPELLNSLGTTMAAVIREGRYRRTPLFAPTSIISVEDDPTSQTSIFIEAADTNHHQFIVVPFHRRPDGRVILEEPMPHAPSLVNEIFLKGVKFTGEKADPNLPKLIEGAAQGSLRAVKEALSSGIAVDASYGNTTALLEAAAKGQVAVAEELFRRGAAIDKGTPQGWTPLMLASLNGQVEMVRLLLDRGAAVNAKWTHYGDYGGTALMAAATNGFTRVIGLLLERGADIAMRDEQGATALSEAATGGHLTAVQLLVEKGADLQDQVGAFIAACAQEHVAIARYFMAQGLGVDARGPNGLTALMKASLCGNDTVVKVLLECGADPWIRDAGGETALDKTENPSIRRTLRAAMKIEPRGDSESSE